MSKTITLKFEGFWDTFDLQNNKFVDALRARFDVTVLEADCDDRPDILIYSWYDQRHLRYDSSVKVYYTGENDVPDFNECDYAISFHHIDFGGRHLRYPLYMLYEYDMAKAGPRNIADDAAAKRDFCSCLIRNFSNCSPRRLEIIDRVEAYRPIAYGGPWRNNTGGPVDEKIPFISRYKFNLALENSAIPGYVTEKILEPLAAETVPVYWGAPDVARDFNPEAYINVADYASLDSFVEALRRIDSSDDEYLRILRAPIFTADIHTDFDAQLSDFLCGIADRLDKRVSCFGHNRVLHERNRALLPLADNKIAGKLLSRLGRRR